MSVIQLSVNSYPLPTIEIYAYLLIWTTHSMLAFLISIKATNKHKVGNWLDHWLEPSSYVEGIRMDNSDVEWKLFRTALQTTIFALLIHSVLFKIVRTSKSIPKPICSLFMIFFWLILHVIWSSPKCVILIAAFTIISIAFTLIIKGQCLVWIFAIAFISKISDLAPFSTSPTNYYREFNLYLYSAIKVVNLCTYLVRSKKCQIDRDLLVDFSEYMLYPPYSMAIIVLFENYKKQTKLMENIQIDSHAFFIQIVKDVLRLSLWFFLLELLLHLFSVNALFNSPFTMLKNFNNYELASIAYVAGHLFHLKYVLILGLSSLFAKIDGMTPPKPPICISRVSKYSNMWRYFDRGLYSFLKNQVYIPLINETFYSIDIRLRKLCAMFSVFIFILIWHGMNSNYFWWVCCSIFELCIERLTIDLIWPSALCQQILMPKLSTANFIRFKAFFMLATVIPGIFGIFFFLGHAGVGAYIFKHVFIEGLVQIFTLDIHFFNSGWVLMHLLLMGYTFNHVCLYVEYVLSDQNHFKKSV